MFSEFVEARAGEAGRRSWAIVISTMSQAVALLVLLLVPLIYTQALPAVLSLRSLLDAPVPLVAIPEPPKAPLQTVKLGKRIFDGGVLHAPTHFPAKPLVFQEPELPPELPANNGNSGFANVDLFNLTTKRSEAEPPPVMPVPIQRIRQSQIQQAMIAAQSQPVYPPLAVIARIQGDVFLHAIIDREGRVAELEFVSGNPLLARAALDAVRTWRYRPTLLNGEPVEVETTIKVSFVLGR